MRMHHESRPNGRQRLQGALVAVATLVATGIGSMALADRIDVLNGVVTTVGEVVTIGDVEGSWAVQQWSADFTPSGVPGAPTPVEDVVLHVAAAAPAGGDGTIAAPFRTLADAKKVAEKANADGASVRVLVAAGTYREGVHLAKSTSATPAAMVFEGVGRVIISGSDVLAGWTPAGGGLFEAPWDQDWGLDDLPAGWSGSYAAPQIAANPVIRRREMLFVGGSRLRPVTDRGELASTPGSFLADDAAGVLVMNPPAGIDPRQGIVEAGRRSFGFRIGFRHNVTLKNLTFQHASSKMEQKAVQVNDSRGINLIDLDVRQNSWLGLGVSTSNDVIILRVKANDNGSGGLTAYKSDDLLIEDSESLRNNWRGSRGVEAVAPGKVVDPNLVDFASGQKFFHMDGVTFRRFRAENNQSSGLWFDWNNRDVVIEDSTFTGNRTWGVFFEASPGPLTLRRSTISGNEYGVLIGNSEDGTIEDSSIENNAVGQIFVGGKDARSVTTRTGQRYDVRSIGWTIRGNRIGVASAGDFVTSHLASEPRARFFSTSTLTGNTATG